MSESETLTEVFAEVCEGVALDGLGVQEGASDLHEFASKTFSVEILDVDALVFWQVQDASSVAEVSYKSDFFGHPVLDGSRVNSGVGLAHQNQIIKARPPNDKLANRLKPQYSYPTKAYQAKGFGVWGLGFGVWGLGPRAGEMLYRVKEESAAR